ncbi:MAG: DUF935 family protein, partial [Bacteroidales bacterium]
MDILNDIVASIPGTNAYKERVASVSLAAKINNTVKKQRSLLVELNQQTESLTKKDIASWRRAWQAAISYDAPNRCALLDVYNDAMIDLHLSGCIAQRKGKTLQKPFILINKGGKEDETARAIFEAGWFSDFVSLALDSVYYGYSLIQLGDITNIEGIMSFNDVELVPRKHVVPEFAVITREAGDDPKKGVPYNDGVLADWCIGVGKPRDLGLLLKCAPQSLSKKNMLAYWDTFGEIFGMPIRIGKTMSQDSKDISRIEKMLSEMGAAAWGLFPDGTEIEIKESTKGDAFNVYDKRIDRCNSEISKGILAQTMTIDSGSSLSQSETHLEVFENICRADAVMVKYLINSRLIPLMIKHGFPLAGVTFDWDVAQNYSPADQREIERLLIEHYDIDPQYFIDKYKVAITGVKSTAGA